jgi:hypothetical protein
MLWWQAGYCAGAVAMWHELLLACTSAILQGADTSNITVTGLERVFAGAGS